MTSSGTRMQITSWFDAAVELGRRTPPRRPVPGLVGRTHRVTSRPESRVQCPGAAPGSRTPPPRPTTPRARPGPASSSWQIVVMAEILLIEVGEAVRGPPGPQESDPVTAAPRPPTQDGRDRSARSGRRWRSATGRRRGRPPTAAAAKSHYSSTPGHHVVVEPVDQGLGDTERQPLSGDPIEYRSGSSSGLAPMTSAQAPSTRSSSTHATTSGIPA